MKNISDSLQSILHGQENTQTIVDLCDSLGSYLQIGCDEISFMMFLSRASGALGLPLNLALFSSDPTAENIIADRIANLVPETVDRVETISRFRAIAENKFCQTELVIARSLHDELFRYACEITTRDSSSASFPSIWTVTDERSTVTILGPTLELMSMQTERSLRGFGHHYSARESDGDCDFDKFRRLLLTINSLKCPRCPFQNEVRAPLKPFQMLVANRLMSAIAALRIGWNIQNLKHQKNDHSQVSLTDYLLARDLLINLPLPPQHSNLSPQSLETADVLFDQFVTNGEYQNSVPDNSDLGRKVFTRQVAAKATGLSYNTIKAHLSCLEQNGILESRVVSTSQRHSLNRGQGRQIYFKFQESRAPPFTQENPFSLLPTPDEIAKD